MADEEVKPDDFIIGSKRVGELPVQHVLPNTVELPCSLCGHLVYVSPTSQKIIADAAAEGNIVLLRCADYCIPPDDLGVLDRKNFMAAMRGEEVPTMSIMDEVPFVVKEVDPGRGLLAMGLIKGAPLVGITIRDVDENGNETSASVILDIHRLMNLTQAFLDKTEAIGLRLHPRKE